MSRTSSGPLVPEGADIAGSLSGRPANRLITIIAAPPPGAIRTADPFIDGVCATLAGHGVAFERATSVLELDLLLKRTLAARPGQRLSVQLVGHSISGQLLLGAAWMSRVGLAAKATEFPFYVLDTKPTALGLLAKYEGKLADLTLVGCNIGAASSYGYAINGRTLTYTLTELLHCPVRASEDLVHPSEFDATGRYVPGPKRDPLTGWDWHAPGPPTWFDGNRPRPAREACVTQPFEITHVTGSWLPIPAARSKKWPLALRPRISIDAAKLPGEELRHVVPEVSVIVRDRLGFRRTADLLSGGRFLRVGAHEYSVVSHQRALEALTPVLWLPR